MISQCLNHNLEQVVQNCKAKACKINYNNYGAKHSSAASTAELLINNCMHERMILFECFNGSNGSVVD